MRAESVELTHQTAKAKAENSAQKKQNDTRHSVTMTTVMPLVLQFTEFYPKQDSLGSVTELHL